VRQARADGLTGEEAFYQLAALEGASFAFVTSGLKGAPNISTPTMPLLMEANAARRRGHPAAGPPPGPEEKSIKDIF
jgi:hypothetical protein